MDEQRIRELADYFTTGATPAGVAELPPPPAPAEGGQGEVGELTEEGKMALAARGELTTLGERIPDVSKGGTIERPGLPGGGAGEVGAVLPGQGMRDEDIKALADHFTRGQQPGGLGPLADVLFAATGPAGPALQTLANYVPAFRDFVKGNVAGGLENIITGAAAAARWPELGFQAAGVEEPGPLKFLSDRLKAVQEAGVPAIKEAAEAVLPTSQDLDQSPVGQIASGAGQLGSQIAFGLMGPGVLFPALGLQLAGQTFDEAKAHGADD